MLYLFSKCVNVTRVQSSDRNMDGSIFRTIYIMARASYVNFAIHYALRNDVTMARAYVCRINLLSIFDHNTESKITYYVACVFVSSM